MNLLMSKRFTPASPSGRSPASAPVSSSRVLLAAVSLLGGLFLSSQAGYGQSVATTPVGAMTYTFPATTQVTTTYISIPLTNPAVYTGPVASLTANTITFSGTPFTSGELAQTGSPFFARIATGPQAGRTMLVTGNTANSITVDTTDNSSQTTALNLSGWSVAQGNRVEIIVGDTLAGMFGDGSGANPLKFTGGSNILSSDAVAIYSKTSARLISYFYSTELGYWRTTSSTTNQNNLILYPENAIAITRRENRPSVSLSVIGIVPEQKQLTKITGNTTTIHSSHRLPVDIMLGDITLPNWTKADNILLADTFGIYNPSTARFDTYFQTTSGSWRRSGAGTADQSSVVIHAGTMVAFLKRAPVSGIDSFIAFNLGYTL